MYKDVGTIKHQQCPSESVKLTRHHHEVAIAQALECCHSQVCHVKAQECD
jgi:hypothetical protein